MGIKFRGRVKVYALVIAGVLCYACAIRSFVIRNTPDHSDDNWVDFCTVGSGHRGHMLTSEEVSAAVSDEEGHLIFVGGSDLGITTLCTRPDRIADGKRYMLRVASDHGYSVSFFNPKHKL